MNLPLYDRGCDIIMTATTSSKGMQTLLVSSPIKCDFQSSCFAESMHVHRTAAFKSNSAFGNAVSTNDAAVRHGFDTHAHTRTQTHARTHHRAVCVAAARCCQVYSSYGSQAVVKSRFTRVKPNAGGGGVGEAPVPVRSFANNWVQNIVF